MTDVPFGGDTNPGRAGLPELTYEIHDDPVSGDAQFGSGAAANDKVGLPELLVVSVALLATLIDAPKQETASEKNALKTAILRPLNATLT